jgi:hypothetical protein
MNLSVADDFTLPDAREIVYIWIFLKLTRETFFDD